MTMQDALGRAMGGTVDSEAAARLRAAGGTVVNEDSLCKAIHEVFCGELADHSEPNEKDRQQARALMTALEITAADEMTV